MEADELDETAPGPATATVQTPAPVLDLRLAVPAIASAAAAVLHAAAAGIHADHPALARVFVALAVLQGAVAVLGFVRPDRRTTVALVAVNLVALAGWIATRLTGIAWIDGLEIAERPQLADSISAAFAAVAIAGSMTALGARARAVPARTISNAAIVAGILVVPGLLDATTHDHGTTDADHAHDAAATVGDDGHSHATTGTTGSGTTSTDPGTGSTSGSGIFSNGDVDGALSDLVGGVPGQTADHAHAWPRPWDPSQPIDFSGVAGVTAEQQARAEQLVRDTLRELPAFADVTQVGTFGYQSIGDAGTGFEHYVNYGLIGDDVVLDPTQPESLVYRVDGEQRTLVSAMFIAGSRPIDDPELVDFGGPLMQWHVHDNLCWGIDDDGQPKVVAVLEAPGDVCPATSVNAGAENPMVHVWIAPHECGPFAALEGHGAGQADPTTGERVDQCAHDHATTPAPFDPGDTVDLSGTPGVTAEQQAFAENLVETTLAVLPQWQDLAAVEAAGFHSIGDAGTGHEHYINWEWIDDDVVLDPERPESLVFRPGPDGTKELVSAMYMLPRDTALDEVPDWGGPLMQWHVHGDLCFTDDPVAPVVVGTKPIDGSCPEPWVEAVTSPMIHVWIVPNECGPFAALEGIGGGQVQEGEAVRCDHAHGSS